MKHPMRTVLKRMTKERETMKGRGLFGFVAAGRTAEGQQVIKVQRSTQLGYGLLCYTALQKPTSLFTLCASCSGVINKINTPGQLAQVS